jgi:hypothetical protein
MWARFCFATGYPALNTGEDLLRVQRCLFGLIYGQGDAGFVG